MGASPMRFVSMHARGARATSPRTLQTEEVAAAVNDVVTTLLAEGLLDADAARQVREAMAAGKSTDDALRAVPGLPEERILRFLAAQFDLPFVDLEAAGIDHAPPKELLGRFPARIPLDHHIMPLS